MIANQETLRYVQNVFDEFGVELIRAEPSLTIQQVCSTASVLTQAYFTAENNRMMEEATQQMKAR